MLLLLYCREHASQSQRCFGCCFCFSFSLPSCLLRFIRIPSLLVWESNSEWMCRRRPCRHWLRPVASRRVAAAASSLLHTHTVLLRCLCCCCVAARRLSNWFSQESDTNRNTNNNASFAASSLSRCFGSLCHCCRRCWLIPKKWSSSAVAATRTFRFVSFCLLEWGRMTQGGMLRWRCVLVAVVVVVVVPFWRELDLKHDADNDDDDADDDDDTKRAFGDGNFWFDCVKRRRNAMRRCCCCCCLLLLFGAPNRRRQRSVLITLLLLLFCCSPLFPPPTHTQTRCLSQMLWLNVLLSRSHTHTYADSDAG